MAGIELSSKASEGRAIWADEKDDVLKVLQPVLGDEKRRKIVHDPKLFQLLAGRVEKIEHATQLYDYLLRPTTAKHEFADVIFRNFNTPIGGGAGERADCLQRLAPVLRKQVEEQGLAEVYEKIDLPLAAVLAEIERNGIRVDPKALEKMSESMEREVRRLEKDIWKLAGSEFNVNSPAQLAEILFDKLNLQPPSRRGKGKERSTAADVLEEMANQHELPAKVIEYREIAKLKSTYVDALPKLIHPETGRLHTSFSQTGTATGRLSSSDPNLQNIPIRSELGREIRAAFVAEKGKILLSADYSQIELRIMAHFSRDPVLVEAFRHGEDIHARTAQEVFGVGPACSDRRASPRRESHQFRDHLWVIGFRLGEATGDRAEGSRTIHQRVFHPLSRRQRISRQCAGGNAQDRLGQNAVREDSPDPRNQCPANAIAKFRGTHRAEFPAAGHRRRPDQTGHDFHRSRLREKKLATRMILQVHDELLFEAPVKEKEVLEKLVREEMEGVQKLAVPLVVEIGTGPNWRDLD